MTSTEVIERLTGTVEELAEIVRQQQMVIKQHDIEIIEENKKENPK